MTAVLVAVVAAGVVVVVRHALRVHHARQQAFIGSFDRPPTLGLTPAEAPPPAPVMTPARRRRRVLKRLLVAMAATAVAGLLPPLRLLLAVHLLLDDAFIAYVAVLAYRAERRAAAAVPPTPAIPAVSRPERAWRWAARRRAEPAITGVAAGVGLPVAPVG